MKNTINIATAIALVLATPAFAADSTSETTSKVKIEKDADGSYKQKRSTTAQSTDANGTTTQSETTVKMERDADGNDERSVTTETSKDPKGLMNKTKTVTKDAVKAKEDGTVTTSHTKKVDGKTVENTKEESKASH